MEMSVIKSSDKISREELIEKLYTVMSSAIRNSKAVMAKEWLKERGLTTKATGAGYNSRSIHLNNFYDYKEELEAIGFLSRAKVVSCTAEKTYRPFAPNSIIFPLRNEKGEVVNFYAVLLKKEQSLYWNEEGIYPAFPEEDTKRLYVVDDIIEAATLLETKLLREGEAVIALREGKIIKQHRQAIDRLKKLQDIIVIKTPQINKSHEHK